MDSTGSGQREMQSPPVSVCCRRPGCVFYAHQLFDGMCSKCYKELKEQTQTQTSTHGSSANNNAVSSTIQTSTALVEVSQPSGCGVVAVEGAASATSLSFVPKKDVSERNLLSSDIDIEQLSMANSMPSSPKEKTKKKRCDTCNKRVGLTGFDCRCGGHYCSVHRYSDMHSCAFNYRELAQSEIRKQNPVVAAEKVKKI